MTETKTETLMWLAAAAECFPKLKLKGLFELKAKIDALGAGCWAGALAGGSGFSRIGLRYYGTGDFSVWAKKAGVVAGAVLPAGLSAPPAPFPWLELFWDAEGGKLSSVSVLSADGGAGRASRWAKAKGGKPAASRLDRAPFSAELFRELGLEEAFAQFARLCPVAEIVSESTPGAGGKMEPTSAWALFLREAAPWPLVLRLDVGAPFTTGSTQQSFLMLNRKVSELGFTKDSMWAWFSD